MKVFHSISEFRSWRKSLVSTSVGFVPTMGALHGGHRSLLERAAAENDVVILSLFVNPTQFNRPDDFEKYPMTVEADLAMAAEVGVDAVLFPKDSKELYPDDYRFQLSEREFSKTLCGEHRPGHFEGVLTIVMKLLQIVRADRAYFGEKDFQQFSLIRGMAEAFFLDTEIIACPTVREVDGLAMSSRNLRLSADDRVKAPEMYRAMTTTSDLAEAKRCLEGKGFRVDYLEDVKLADGSERRFAAAFLGDVRLIDNVAREL